jgi:putative restriction endonuclease
MGSNTVTERNRRDVLWNMILVSGGPLDLPPATLRDLLVYSGARGIFTDVQATQRLAPDGGAVTLSLLHTGKVYPDELSDDGIVYHYPSTGQSGRDAQEIAATKACGELGLPLFVITTSRSSLSLRDVRRGWVLGWDNEASTFYVQFGDEQPQTQILAPSAWESAPFKLKGGPQTAMAVVPARPGQAKFKFDVFAFYGAACVACGISFDGLLDAAHLCDKRNGGSDDPRNGLVLCALHHRALDRNYWAIYPESLSIVARQEGPSLGELGISYADLSHLMRRPHPQAIAWRWEAWQRIIGQEPNASPTVDSAATDA